MSTPDRFNIKVGGFDEWYIRADVKRFPLGGEYYSYRGEGPFPPRIAPIGWHPEATADDFTIYKPEAEAGYRHHTFEVTMRVAGDDQTDPADMVEIITDILNGKKMSAYRQAIEETEEEMRPQWVVEVK